MADLGPTLLSVEEHTIGARDGLEGFDGVGVVTPANLLSPRRRW
jgi:hypothetical protein